METTGLRRMRESARLERLLEAYIWCTSILPDGSYQVRDPHELPKSLQVVLARAIEAGQVWSCWALGARLWLFTCPMSLPQSRERGTPPILLHHYERMHS